MISYIYMKILEGRPESYDRRIGLLSGGETEAMKLRMAEYAEPGTRALEIGCGAGRLALLAAERGARVTAFDASAGMVETARENAARAGLDKSAEFREMTVGAMDSLPSDSFDLVMSTLVFSELYIEERRYALEESLRALKRGGLFVAAYDARPRGRLRRAAYSALRGVMVTVNLLLSRPITSPADELPETARAAGFIKIENEPPRSLAGYALLRARKA